MNTTQIIKSGRKLFGSKFIGAFPLNLIPKQLKNGYYIVNTHPWPKPGEHWIALKIKSKEIQLFDPFGVFYPPQLIKKLQKTHKKLKFSNTMYQNMFTTNCGQLCLLWLTLN